MKQVLEFIYKLFFTRDDDLDTLQVLFAAIVIVTLMITWKITTGMSVNDTVRIEGMVTLRWLTGLLVITAVPKWLVPFISNHKKEIDKEVLTPPTLDSSINEEYHMQEDARPHNYSEESH